MSFTLSYSTVNSVPVIVGTAPGANGGINISIAIDYTAQANLIVTALQNIDANTSAIRAAIQNIDANTNATRAAIQNIDANINTMDANIAAITLVGTTGAPTQANGFITRSKYEDYNNLLFLQYILDPNVGFTNFPAPLNPQQQEALNAIQSWVSAANTYVPPTDV